MHWLLHILGLDNASGVAYLTWSGVVGDVSILGGFAAWLRKSGKQHRERLAQEARHHRAAMEQAAGHHIAHMELLRKHQTELHVRADQHADLIAAAATQPHAPAEKVVPAKQGTRL